MEKFRYRFVKPEIFSAETNAIFDAKLTEQEKIEDDIAVQLTTICDAIEAIKKSQQITTAQLQEDMHIIKGCSQALEEDTNVDDMKLSTLIGYANALSGILKIHVELDDGSQVELL